MIAAQEQSLQHILLHNISWEAYEILLHDVGESHVRLTYDDGDLEIMTVSFGHENCGEWIGRLIFFLALEMKVPLCSGGSTTMKKSLRRKGLESDKTFWIKHELAMRGKRDWDGMIDPPPDLAVEIDITSSSLNRLAIYASLGVPEIWRFNGETFSVLHLTRSGEYKERQRSLAFPKLPLREFAGFIAKLGTTDEVSLIQEYIDWVRGTLSQPRRKGNR